MAPNATPYFRAATMRSGHARWNCSSSDNDQQCSSARSSEVGAKYWCDSRQYWMFAIDSSAWVASLAMSRNISGEHHKAAAM